MDEPTITEHKFDWSDCDGDKVRAWVDGDGKHWIQTISEDETEGSVPILLSDVARRYLALFLMGAAS